MLLQSNNSASTSFLTGATDEDDIDFTDYSAPFLSGHGFALQCHWWFSPKMSKLGINPNRDNRALFCRTDDLPLLFGSKLVPDKFVLVTHNSDFVVCGPNHARIAEDPRVERWFALNKGLDHPKVKSIPDGLQNACYGYGNVALLSAIANSLGAGLPNAFGSYKTKMFHANYTIDSRFMERGKCAAVCQPQGISLDGRKPYVNYLADLSTSMYALCPAGSGIDSCRPWESIYLRAIPIVVRSYTALEHMYMPTVVINDWTADHFSIKNFSVESYTKLWNDFDPAEMHIDRYCARLNRLYGGGL